MTILFSELIRDKAFNIKNRKALKEFYDTTKNAVKAKKLNLEGHTLPVSLNDWFSQIEPDKPLPKRDTDVVDFSISEDKKYHNWRKAYLIAQNPIFMNQAEKNLVESLQALENANTNSIELMNGSKDDLVTALSDIQAAISILLTTYDSNKKKLALPDRTVALERVKIGKAK